MAQCDEQDYTVEVAREEDKIQEGHELDEFQCEKNPGHSDDEEDYTIEVAREEDILECGEDVRKFKKCKKNPGHSGFIRFKDLKLDDLPEEIRNTETLKTIETWGKFVVRLVVDKIKNGKRVTKTGSGIVHKILDYGFHIQTNNHVVGTDDDVKNCKVEFHYDSHDRSKVLTIQGVKLLSTSPIIDISWFTIEPVPDFIIQMDKEHPIYTDPTLVIKYKNNKNPVTKPVHTFNSQPFYYSDVNINDPQIEKLFITLVDKSYSYLKSCYFHFQPIPSNIQVFTSIEIHIDEDVGNSRVIPGKVGKFNDDYVVEISESIFQDEVKKCRLVMNGKVISRGTRLYFPSVEIKKFFNKLTEFELGLYTNDVGPIAWRLDFLPLPKDKKNHHKTIRDDIMCCIGHPHGGIKMVTFGRWLEQSKVKFDKNLKLCKHKPEEDCNCKEITGMKYSCKTCRGSSGSPVFLLFETIDISYAAVHFLGKRVKRVRDGELIENENMAWNP